MSLVKNGQIEIALNLIDRAIRNDPRKSSFYWIKANILKDIGMISEAIKSLQTLLSIDPEIPLAAELYEELRSLSKNPILPIVKIKDYCDQNPDITSIKTISTIPQKQTAPMLALYSVPNIQISGKDGAMITPEQYLIRESSTVNNSEETLKDFDKTNRNFTFLSGEYLPLCGLWSDAFWHWMTEYLPRIIIAEHGGFTGKFLIRNNPTFIFDSLKRIGIDESRIEYYDGSPVLIEKCIFTTNVISESLHLHFGLIDEMRTKFRHPMADEGRGRRIYIKRSNPDRGRMILNNKQFDKLLRAHNIETIEIEKLSLSDQISFVSSADFIIGPHGAGMYYTMLMRNGGKFIELFSPDFINPCAVPFVKHLNLKYWPVTARLSGEPLLKDNIIAPIDILESILDNIL